MRRLTLIARRGVLPKRILAGKTRRVIPKDVLRFKDFSQKYRNNNFWVYFIPVSGNAIADGPIIGKQNTLGKNGKIWRKFARENRGLIAQLGRKTAKIQALENELHGSVDSAMASVREAVADGGGKMRQLMELQDEVSAMKNDPAYLGALYKAYRILRKMGASNQKLFS